MNRRWAEHLLRLRLPQCGGRADLRVLLAAMAASYSVVLQAQLPQLRPAEAVLATGGQSIPCVVDWNGDGLPDLVVGYQPAWKVAVYFNSGSATQPVFTGFTNLQAGGADIYLPATGCGSPAPWVCDYDDDGKKDLLVGSGADGRVYFYRNANTDTEPMLTSGVTLLLSGSPLSVGIRATPHVHDWDEDGLPDLLCGDGNGLVHWFRNSGTRTAPVYTGDVLLQAGGADLNLGYRSAVRVLDWDGDGVKDLIGSGSDNAAWCRNTGGNGSPVLGAPTKLRAPVSGAGLANIDTGYRMRLEVADWNHDGVMDLLMGNADGSVYLYAGYHFAIRDLVARAGGDFRLQWNSAAFLRYDVMCGDTPDDIQTPLATNLPSGGNTTGHTNHCEAVRRFYRVLIAP